MGKVNVLVFPGAGYPAIEICTYLKHSMRFHVIAASSYPNHSEFVCTETIVAERFACSLDKSIAEVSSVGIT